MPSVIVTPAATNISATYAAPQPTLPVDATGSHCHPNELSGPGPGPPYDHSLLCKNWLITLRKLLLSS